MIIDEKKLGEPLSLKQIQGEQLKMLEKFAEFCVQHGLRYYLTGGTMLGAIRHKGFIPWDDDVDINMPRPDYNKFCELTKNGMGKYKVKLPQGSIAIFVKMMNPDFLMLNAFENIEGSIEKKYINLFIDICPLDGLPTNKLRFKLHALKIHILMGMRGTLRIGIVGNKKSKKIFRFLTYPLARLLGAERLDKLVRESALKYDFESSKYIGAVLTRNRMKDYLPREKYVKQIDIEFENKLFKTTAMYDEHLRILYGNNYMEIPPVEKQNSGHMLKAWRINAKTRNEEE